MDLALSNVLRSLEGLVTDVEIIVIDDGSCDNTRAIAGQWALKDKRISCVRNETNQGYGYSYLRGVSLAAKDHVGVYTADNDMSWESFRELVKQIGQADILSSYMCNTNEREWPRRILSRMFVMIINGVFNIRLKYVNGPFIARRNILQALTVRSRGLTVLAECKVKLMRQGYSCMEIPFKYVPRQGGQSSALSFKSIKAVVKAVSLLFWDVYGWKH